MATTYLQLANELLRELNEVELTAANFADSKGIQTHAKDLVNRSYLDIVNEEPQWPFLAVGESGATDPMYGNTYIETVANTRWYELKTAASSIKDDYGSVDWDNFMLTTVGVSGESAPYTIRNLRYTSTEEWKDYFRLGQNKDDADQANGGTPSRVIGDAIVFPDLYVPVLINRARYYLHQFKDNAQNSAFSLEDYKRGLRTMKLHLLDATPNYFKDDRMRFV